VSATAPSVWLDWIDVSSGGVSPQDVQAVLVANHGPFAWGRDAGMAIENARVLEYLARHSGEVVSRGDIAEHVWDEHYDPLSNVVDVYVKRLRRKLDLPGTESLIRTRRGEGYQLADVP